MSNDGTGTAMPEITITSEITVELLNWSGSDAYIARSAWVSSELEEPHPEDKRVNGLIRSLMRQRHGSPFESGFAEFRVYAPRAVRDEHVRHRIGSYSSASSRYRELETVFYVPPAHRPLKQGPNHKAMKPEYVPLNESEYARYVLNLVTGYKFAVEIQNSIKDIVSSTEAIRWLNPDGQMIPYICRFNPRSLMHFLSLRTHDETATFVSYPMWEIEQVARQIEDIFELGWPKTHAAFCEYGRVAP